MVHSIQHMQSRRAEQWLTPSSTCNGSLHPVHAKPESRAMAHSIQHMQSRRAEQWFTPSSTCKAGEQSNGSLHLAHVMAHSIQHMQSRRAEQWFTPSSTCKAGEQSNGSLHPAQPQRAANHFHTSAYIFCTLACFSIYMYMYSVRQKKLSIPLEHIYTLLIWLQAQLYCSGPHYGYGISTG